LPVPRKSFLLWRLKAWILEERLGELKEMGSKIIKTKVVLPVLQMITTIFLFSIADLKS
jgi:hypothetical protein